MDSLREKIMTRIRHWKRGKIFFCSDFSDLDIACNIRKVLQRLVDKEMILRLSTGIYLYPEILPDYLGAGLAYPGNDNIALAIARRDKLRIAPTIATAQNVLGLSTQVPMKSVYWTDGSTRTIKINGLGIINFRHSDKMSRFAFRNRIMQLIVYALEDADMKEDAVKKLVLKNLRHVNDADFNHDIALANDYIRDYLLKLRNDEIQRTEQKRTTASS